MPIRLQERDFKIFRFINGMRNGDGDILSCYFFDSNISSRRRFLKLEKAGYLRKLNGVSPNGYKRYSITKKALDKTRLFYPDVVIPNLYKGDKDVESEHDRMVAITRLYLKKNNISYGFRPEREILSELSKNSASIKRIFLPDGLFFDSKKNKVCLEYELTVKSTQRIKKKIYNHNKINGNSESNWSLFVVRNLKAYDYIKSLESNRIKVISSIKVEDWYNKLIIFRV